MPAPRIPIAAALALAFCGAAAAQPTPATPAPAPLMTAPRAGDRTAAPPAQPTGTTPLPPVTVEDAQRLAGRTVTTQDGQAQAVIHGAVHQDGTVTGLILDTGSGRTVTVPAQVLRVGSDGTLTIAMTAEALAATR